MRHIEEATRVPIGYSGPERVLARHQDPQSRYFCLILTNRYCRKCGGHPSAGFVRKPCGVYPVFQSQALKRNRLRVNGENTQTLPFLAIPLKLPCVADDFFVGQCGRFISLQDELGHAQHKISSGGNFGTGDRHALDGVCTGTRPDPSAANADGGTRTNGPQCCGGADGSQQPGLPIFRIRRPHRSL